MSPAIQEGTEVGLDDVLLILDHIDADGGELPGAFRYESNSGCAWEGSSWRQFHV